MAIWLNQIYLQMFRKIIQRSVIIQNQKWFANPIY